MAIQGENKQDYLDANSPSEIEKRMRRAKSRYKAYVPRTTVDIDAEVKKKSQGMQKLTRKLVTPKFQDKYLSKDAVSSYENIERAKLQKIEQIKKRNRLSTREIRGIAAVESVGESTGKAVARVGQKVYSKVKGFFKNEIARQVATNAAQERVSAQRRAAYINQQRKIAEMKRKQVLSQRMQNINNQRRQVQIRRPQLSPLQQQQMMIQQQLLRQRQIAEQKRQLVRTLTPGFYNPRAERVNPFGLASRYKLNFGQNVFTEKDPENQKVHVNGKYKWRAD